MNQTSIIGFAIAAMTLGCAAQAATIIGSISFSSGPNGGVVLQDSGAIVTTNVLNAAGIQSWLFPQVDLRSDSFVSVSSGQAVSFPQAWVFNPSTPSNPLWTIEGPDNFAFNLFDATIVLQNEFLLIAGTGTLTGTGFTATPATWFFSTRGTATDGKFGWSSTTTAVPELGVPALLGAALLGGCFLRRRNPAPFSPQNKHHETNISPPDVRHRLAGHHVCDPS